MSIILCPGSFDPFTLGHRFIVERAAALYDEVVVAVVVNPNKQGMFTTEERIELIASACADIPNVRVDRCRGLLVDYMRNAGITTMIKGLRSTADLEYEVAMAQMNRELANVETFFLWGDPRFAHVSSSLVKEIAKFGGSVESFLPPNVFAAVIQKVNEELSM